MEMRDLLEKMMKFAGEKTGQKPGDQWRGSDKAPPGKKLVGDSILKDLSKGKTPKTKEQELSEEFQAFLEAEFKDTVDKRPGRKSDRRPRGHEPVPRYKTIKTDEGVPYKATNPHPASKDPIVAKVLKQMRPGLTGLEMNNEAFLYFAYEIGKMRAREMWEDYGPAIKYFYQSGIGVNEGWESGPEEYEEPYDDADDAYDRQRQEKIDTEAEKEWAKLPKVSTYKLVGRGPNMEPNYEFGDTEYDTLEQAIEARKQLMADPKTPHPEHIGIQTLTRVVDKQQTNEAVYTAPQNKEQYDAKMAALQDLQNDPNTANDQELQKKIIIYMDNLQKIAHQKGWLSQPVESRGHKIVATKLKDIERSKNFRVPSAEERRELAQRMKDFEAQLAAAKSKKKQVKEYGATNNVSPYGQPATTPGVDPKQLAQGMQQFKAATGSTAPTTNLAKAIDTLSQGKLPTQQMVKDIQPAMKDLATITQNPNLASGAAKTAFQQANQARIKQQQLAKK